MTKAPANTWRNTCRIKLNHKRMPRDSPTRRPNPNNSLRLQFRSNNCRILFKASLNSKPLVNKSISHTSDKRSSRLSTNSSRRSSNCIYRYRHYHRRHRHHQISSSSSFRSFQIPLHSLVNSGTSLTTQDSLSNPSSFSSPSSPSEDSSGRISRTSVTITGTAPTRRTSTREASTQ